MRIGPVQHRESAKPGGCIALLFMIPLMAMVLVITFIYKFCFALTRLLRKWGWKK